MQQGALESLLGSTHIGSHGNLRSRIGTLRPNLGSIQVQSRSSTKGSLLLVSEVLYEILAQSFACAGLFGTDLGRRVLILDVRSLRPPRELRHAGGWQARQDLAGTLNHSRRRKDPSI